MNTSEYNRMYYKKNKERIKKRRSFANLSEEEKEKIRNRNLKWLKENKEKWNTYLKEYRKRKKEETCKKETN